MANDRHRSDAELIAAAYHREGSAALPRLRGSFALVLWDRRRRRVVCARDPLGTHPLFYAEIRSKIFVSPSLERLRRHPDVSSQVNAAALVDHLCHRWPDPGETLFASIRRVPVAHVLRIESGRSAVAPYWELPAPEDWIADDQLEAFDELFERAVSRQLELGAQGAGIYLSGGFDSVSVAAVASDLTARRGESRPWALSLGFPHPDCDEREIQKAVASKLQLPQILMPFDEAVGPQGFVTAGTRLSSELPLPLVNVWRPAYLGLAREARRRGCGVILTGAGGDEWLTVNPMHMADLIRGGNLAQATRFGRTLMNSYGQPRVALLRFIVWHAGLKPLILLAGRRTTQRFVPEVVRMKRRRDLNRLTPPWVSPSGELKRDVSRRIEQRAEQRMHEPEPSRGYGFYFRGMDSPIVHPERSRDQEEDFWVGQSLGIRIQHPYWDPDLVHFLCRVPPRLLLSGGREKSLVRAALDRRFPDVGFERQRKVTATNFYRALLEADALSCWSRLGGATALAALGVVDPAAVDRSIRTMSTGSQSPELHQLCELMHLEAWVRPRL
jgi:asparagine synthase (glutamine-hydrolysing)